MSFVYIYTQPGDIQWRVYHVKVEVFMGTKHACWIFKTGRRVM